MNMKEWARKITDEKVRERYVNEVIERFRDRIIRIERNADNQWIIEIRKEDLPEVIGYIINHPEWKETQLSTMVGADERPLRGKFSLIYWISINGASGDVVFGIKTYISEDDPKFPSVTPIHPGANWYEREVKDLLGLIPEGHPDPRRLVLPDDWPEGVYPLRKDFHYTDSPKREFTDETKYPYREPPKGTAVFPLGPYHVALDEPGHFRLYVKGEEIVDVDYRLFYQHRGIEKIGENRLTYDQVNFIAERICGICGTAHALAYAQAVEAAGGVEVPERAEYIRTVMAEIERLHSHLLNLGLACHDVGFDKGFMDAFRLREHVMWLAERLTGNRKTYGMVVIGGVRRDFLEYRRSMIEKVIRELREGFQKWADQTLSTKTFVKRCEGVGVLSYKDAKRWSSVGPWARGSGRDLDARRDHPFAAYKYLDFKVPVYKEGDVLARCLVRAEEILESIWIIEQALDEMPGGDILAEWKEIPPYQEAVGFTEAPRGEDVHYVMTGEGNRLYRWRIRASTYNNFPALPDAMRGNSVADAVLIIASMDPCYSCTERVQVVDARSGKVRVLTEKELTELSRKASRGV
ncbi:formate hydrogenlyase II subunit F (Mhy2F) [Thermococcus gammatolerans EJ3]|uniref:Formate hydrogenlyase II subunit F (Mhy2F) n=2 Tax=Thermococcus TaxID=2263 RepID=C5A2Q9_THEGJ|nr:formate hydrogenlyase II subunit F (Mhy2F) [Thermococcus gammatolerans EJ3]